MAAGFRLEWLLPKKKCMVKIVLTILLNYARCEDGWSTVLMLKTRSIFTIRQKKKSIFKRRIVMNRKTSSNAMASKAARALNSNGSSKIQKSLAASVLSQRSTSKQTGVAMEDIASRVLQSNKYSNETKSFAASVLSQSNVKR